MKTSNRREFFFDRKANRFFKKSENPALPPVELAIHPDHPLPRTRREFLQAGLVQSFAMITAPTWMNALFTNKAYAEGALNTAILFIHGSGGPGGLASMTPREDSSGNLISAGGLNAAGIFVNPSGSGVVSSEFGAPLMMQGNPLVAALFQRNAGTAQTQLLNDGTNYSWNGVSAASRDAVLNKTSVAFAAVETNDDGGAAGQRLSPTLALASLLGGGEYISSGLKIGNGSASVGVNTLGLGIQSSIPPFLPVTNGVSSVLQALSNPTGGRSNDAQAERIAEGSAAMAAAEAAAQPKAILDILQAGHSRNVASIQAAATLVLTPATVLNAETNTILGQMNGGANLGACMAAAFTNVSMKLVAWDPSGGDHHNGGGYLNASVAYAKEMGKGIAAFLNEARARNMNAMVLYTGGGAMKGYTGIDPATGLTAGASSDEGRHQMSMAIYYSADGRRMPRYETLGSHAPDTGFANTTGFGGNPQNAALWTAVQAAAVLYPNDWQDRVRSIIESNAFSGIALSSVPAWVL